jgi:hypothetical protein
MAEAGPIFRWVGAYDERANAVKAIEYRLEIAKQRKKTTPETLS